MKNYFLMLFLIPPLMSFFTFRNKAKIPILRTVPNTEVDTTITLIPGKLVVFIKTHEISWHDQKLQCLSYVTSGLAQLGQKELVLTLEDKGGLERPYPESPLEFFNTVYHLSSEGRFVEEGGATEFKKTFLGKKAIIYMKRPDEISGLKTPEDYLCMILLTEKEIDAVNHYGFQRILSILGNVYRHYPSPYWNDLSRKELSLSEIYETSFLNQAYAIPLSKSTVTQIGDKVILKISRGAEVVKKLPSATIPIAILPSLDLSADGCFTWNPEQLSIISPYTDASQLTGIGGCFLLLVPDQDTPLVRVIEDGFALLMTNKQWKQFWKAFQTQKPFSIESYGDDLSFSVEWVDQVNQREKIPYSDFHNLFDQKVYSAQWMTVQSDTISLDTGKVQMEFIRMISDNATFSGNVDGEVLGGYAKLVADAVSGIPHSGSSGRFVIQVTLSHSSLPVIEIAFENTVSENYLQKVYESANAVEGITTKKENIIFQINMVIKE